MNAVLVTIALVAFLLIEALIGGTRLLFSIPSYTLLAVAGCLSIARWRKSATGMNPWCLASVAILFTYVIWRATASPVPYLARQDLFMVLGALILFLLFSVHLTEASYRYAMIAGFFLLAGVHVFIGLLQFTKGENYMPIGFLQRPDYGVRASGLYICPNHLAGFLHVTTLFALAMACWSRCRASVKLVAAYIALVCMTGLILTLSRGGFLSMAGSLLVFVALSLLAAKRAYSGKLALWVAVALAVLGALGAGAKYFADHSDQVRNRAAIMIDMRNMRFLLWKAALDQHRVEPILGTGSGTFLYYGRRFRTSEVDNDPIRAHNDYLEFLAEYGIVGAAFFLLFLGAHLANGWKSFRWIVAHRLAETGRFQSDTLALNIAALSSVAAYALHSVVDFNLHIPANALLMAFVFAILANPGPGVGARSPRWTGFFGRIALPGLAVWFLMTGPGKLLGEKLAEDSRTAMRDGQYRESIQLAQQAILEEPLNPEPYYYLGWCRFALSTDPALHPMAGRILIRKSSEAFKAGLDVFPHDTRMLIDYAETARLSGNWKAAESAYEEALEWDPTSAWNRARYGFGLMEHGDLERAADQFERSLSLKPTPIAQEGKKKLEGLRPHFDDTGSRAIR